MSFSDLFTSGETTLHTILWPIFAGIVTAAFITLFRKHIFGSFIRRLLNDNANSPVSAKSLEETGFSKNHLVRFALKYHKGYRRIVHCCPSHGVLSESTEAKPVSDMSNLDELKFYIPSDEAGRAEAVYSSDGTTLITVLIAILLFFVITIITFYLIPDLIQMLKNLIDYIKS